MNMPWESLKIMIYNIFSLSRAKQHPMRPFLPETQCAELVIATDLWNAFQTGKIAHLFIQSLISNWRPTLCNTNHSKSAYKKMVSAHQIPWLLWKPILLASMSLWKTKHTPKSGEQYSLQLAASHLTEAEYVASWNYATVAKICYVSKWRLRRTKAVRGWALQEHRKWSWQFFCSSAQ